MKNLLMLGLILIASPLWAEPRAEPLALSEAASVPSKAEELETEARHKEIVVITEAEFVPISKYFQRLDPNQLEPSAAGLMQPVNAPLKGQPH